MDYGTKLLKQKRLYQESYNYIGRKYDNRSDPDNIYGVGVTDREFVKIIIDELLGKDWHVVDPIGHEQVSEIALYEILYQYSPKMKGKGYK